VNRVVQKGDAAAENAAKNLRYNQTERGGHGPAKHRGAQRGVRVSGVRVAGGMRMTGVTVIVRMSGHPLYSTRAMAAVQPFRVLIRQYDTSPRELIDAPAVGCDHEASFPFRSCWCGTSLHAGALRSEQ
jgi:hypothetical protein